MARPAAPQAVWYVRSWRFPLNALQRRWVDGETGEGRAGLGAIGGDHLGKLGHEFGRHDQLRHNGPHGPPRVAAVVHNENEPPARADSLYARQRLAERVWRGIRLIGRFGAFGVALRRWLRIGLISRGDYP
jgi:hypothetical protein